MAVDFIQKSAGNSASTTLSSSVSNTDTSFPLTSDTNFLSGGGLVIVDEGQATEELAYYTGKSGSSLTVPLVNRGLEGGSPQAHSAGATVKGVLTADTWNNITEALLNVVSVTDGALDTTKVVDLTTSQTLTTKTLTSPVLTTPVINTSISGTAIATGAEIITGTDDTQIVTPKALADATVGKLGAAWSTWTPTWTNISGGTTTYAKYIQIGKTVHFRLKYTLSGANISGTEVSFTPPVTAHADYAQTGVDFVGETHLRDAGTSTFSGMCIWITGGNFAVRVNTASGSYVETGVQLTSTVPFTWANTDMILVKGTYEVA